VAHTVRPTYSAILQMIRSMKYIPKGAGLWLILLISTWKIIVMHQVVSVAKIQIGSQKNSAKNRWLRANEHVQEKKSLKYRLHILTPTPHSWRFSVLPMMAALLIVLIVPKDMVYTPKGTTTLHTPETIINVYGQKNYHNVDFFSMTWIFRISDQTTENVSRDRRLLHLLLMWLLQFPLHQITIVLVIGVIGRDALKSVGRVRVKGYIKLPLRKLVVVRIVW
jgi:hypothetical protein